MNVGAFFAGFVPELRKMSGAQLMKAWQGGTGFSRNKIYLHCVILLVCSSAIFNTFLRLTDSVFLIFIGLVLAMTLPSNIYFPAIFSSRRPHLRQFIEENWEEFRP
jgi:hypothetical protein